MQKIFLTGASSYLGSRLIQRFSYKYEIWGLSRQDATHPCDLKDFDEVTKQFNEFEPDFVIHLAADLGRDARKDDTILETNPAITKHLVELAKRRSIPFIFSSTEAVYGGKEETGGYVEDDEPKPRAVYGESKVLSEKIVKESGLHYLITRGHRYAGLNPEYDRPKQFPDTMKKLLVGEKLHLDSKKLFTPVHIDHLCNVYDHYIENHSNEQIVVNVGTDKQMTFYSLISDIADGLGLDKSNLHPDGEETGWLQNTSISMKKLEVTGFPTVSYEELIDRIVKAYN